MSYHDGYDPRNTGISVVNPLIRIERKLKRVKQVLANISNDTALTAYDLKVMLEEVMTQEDAR
tara:strand:- start:5963 stop:6151 length:189 start_codon:yes stop_codon:yes gene_type:complete